MSLGRGPLVAAIIGLGWWGRQIVDAVAGSEKVVVVQAVDPRIEHCRTFAETRGLLLIDTLEKALEDPTLDAVIIATPHGLHEAQVMAAAEVGKHVFCEKPLALDSTAARRMLTACRDRGLALGVGHERRFEGALEEMAHRVAENDLGMLLHIECNWSHNLFARSADSTWRQDPQQAPAGTLTALGVHITDFFQSTLGRVSEVRAISVHRSDDFASEDVLSVQFQFASGVTGLMCNLATTPFYSRITIFGDRGWIEARENSNVDIPEPAILMWSGMDGDIHTRTYTPTNTTRANIDQWASAALGEGTYRFSDDQLVHNIEILEAIIKSTQFRSVERIPSTGSVETDLRDQQQRNHR